MGKFLKNEWPGLLLGLVATIWVLCQIDSGGLHPGWPEGPGLTIDESFNVQQGVFLCRAFHAYGLAVVDPRSLGEIFQQEIYLADHPPLGRIWLGVHHEFLRWIVGVRSVGMGPAQIDYTLARTGSATAFGLTIALLTIWGGWWGGRIVGVTAGLALLTMPRVFAHAHFASLETTTNLACTAFSLAAAGMLVMKPVSGEGLQPRLPSIPWERLVFVGILYGLALLTKIQAALLLPPVVAWLFYAYRLRAGRAIGIAALAAAIVFFSWPWLWSDPVGHTLSYLGRATNRATLSVWYFGRQFSDRETPWHYPWVLSAITVSLPVWLVGFYGSWLVFLGRLPQSMREPETAVARGRILLRFLLVPLFVFSLPHVAIYDGERLFLIIYPMFALMIGVGTAKLWEHWCRYAWLPEPMRRLEAQCVAGGLLIWLIGMQLWTAPFWLSRYGGLAGGMRGAQALGMEASYWADGLTRGFWDECKKQIPRGATITVAPVLHQFQLDDWKSQVPAIARNDWNLIPLPAEEAASPPGTSGNEYLVVFWRKADLPPALQQELAGRQPLVQRSSGGVIIAGLYQR